MPTQGLGEDSSVLTERLAVPTVIVPFDDREEPPQLFERRPEPCVVRREQSLELLVRRVRGALPPAKGSGRSKVVANRAIQGIERGSNLIEGIFLEEDELVTEPLEPVDQRIEPGRRSGDVDLRAWERHDPGARLGWKAVADRRTSGVVTPSEFRPCAWTMPPRFFSHSVNANAPLLLTESALLSRMPRTLGNGLPPSEARIPPVPEGRTASDPDSSSSFWGRHFRDRRRMDI